MHVVELQRFFYKVRLVAITAISPSRHIRVIVIVPALLTATLVLISLVV